MTPLQIEILLHYYAKPTDYPYMDPTSQQEAFKFFIKNRLLVTIDPTTHGATYIITDKGNAYINALRKMPLPVSVWIIPDQAAPEGMR